MQSEITGHIRAKGNHMCRKCKAGGTEKDKETDTCFHSLFEVRFLTGVREFTQIYHCIQPGIPRSKEEILAELKKQVKLACVGVAQPIKNTQTATGIKDAYMQYWIDYLLEQFKEKRAKVCPGATRKLKRNSSNGRWIMKTGSTVDFLL
jgi:peptide subunit release factor RF-3